MRNTLRDTNPAAKLIVALLVLLWIGALVVVFGEGTAVSWLANSLGGLIPFR